MQQLFGVVLRLCGKCNENKMFSSVQFNFNLYMFCDVYKYNGYHSKPVEIFD